LYGPQGVGKSSLVNAGVIAAALDANFVPERIRFQPRRAAEVLLVRTLADPVGMTYLDSALAPEGSAEARVPMRLELFEQKVIEAARTRCPLLIFDQFEELISQFEETPTGITREEALNIQSAIIETILRLVLSSTLRAKFLFAFREDYLAQLGKVITQIPNLIHASVLLHPIQADGLIEVIRGPFDRNPGLYAPEFHPDLVGQIATAFVEHAKGEINLSEVQIVCQRLWQSPDPAALLAGRSVPGLLNDLCRHVPHGPARTGRSCGRYSELPRDRFGRPQHRVAGRHTASGESPPADANPPRSSARLPGNDVAIDSP
jgi:hypothetical protein